MAHIEHAIYLQYNISLMNILVRLHTTPLVTHYIFIIFLSTNKHHTAYTQH